MKLYCSLLSLFLLLPAAPLFGADNYQVDAGHSSILFMCKRMDVVNVYGRFNELSGAVVFDTETPANSSIELEIKAASIDSNNQRRDDHLRSPDFFNATQFPAITFKSSAFSKTGENKYRVTGDLTLHGVTKSITADVEHTGSGERRGTAVLGFETRFSIKRSEFGMNYMPDYLSDEVMVLFSLHGVAR